MEKTTAQACLEKSRYVLRRLLPLLALPLFTGCPLDSTTPDSQTGNVPSPALSSVPSPIDITQSLFGPWTFQGLVPIAVRVRPGSIVV